MPNHYPFLIASLCALVTSCSSFSIKTPTPEKPHQAPTTPQKPGTERIVIFSHGWHTGVVIPSQALKRHPWTKDLKMGNIPHAEFGWGDEEFYRKPHYNLPMVIRGLFWPTDAVIHLERFSKTPYQHYTESQVVTLELKPEETDAMIDAMRTTFHAHSNGSLVNLGHGVDPDSTFYRSRYKYYYPETCNIWTARLIRAAGVEVKLSTLAPNLIKELRKSPKVVR